MDNSRETEIHRQFDDLVHAYSGLTLSQDRPARWVVRGSLYFCATFGGTTIEDSFAIVLSLPYVYPSLPPTIQEVGERIPRDFHTYPNGDLCLGAPVDVRSKFLRDPNLLPFVNNQVVPFPFSFRYFQDYGKMPYGQLAHGGEGILQYYQDLFHLNDNLALFGLLKILADGSYRGHLPCPCGSDFILRNCHGSLLQNLIPAQSTDRFLHDIEVILIGLQEEDRERLSLDILPKAILKKIKSDSSPNGIRNTTRRGHAQTRGQVAGCP